RLHWPPAGSTQRLVSSDCCANCFGGTESKIASESPGESWLPKCVCSEGARKLASTAQMLPLTELAKAFAVFAQVHVHPAPLVGPENITMQMGELRESRNSFRTSMEI